MAKCTADTAPPPRSKSSALTEHQEQLQKEREKEEYLKAELAERETELSDTRDKLVEIASKVRSNENRMQEDGRRKSFPFEAPGS